MRNVKRSIATQYEQSIHFEPLDAFDDLIGHIDNYFPAIPDHLAGVGIATIRRAQDGAAARQDPAYVFNPKRDYSLFIDKSIISIADAQHLTSILINGRFHHSPDHCI